jgi:hypothetical protein
MKGNERSFTVSWVCFQRPRASEIGFENPVRATAEAGFARLKADRDPGPMAVQPDRIRL